MRERRETSKQRWLQGDAAVVARELGTASVEVIVTGVPAFGSETANAPAGTIGSELTLPAYLERIGDVFAALRRVLKPTGTAWVHVSDSLYSGRGRGRKRGQELRAVDRPGGAGVGARQKSLLGVPWRIAHQLGRNGWSVRGAIQIGRARRTQHAGDRPHVATETLFLLARSRHYRYRPAEMPDEPAPDVWIVPRPPGWRHTRAFAEEIPHRCLLLSGIEAGDAVLDPFAGTGTTLVAAARAGALGIGIEIRGELGDRVAARLAEPRQLRLTSTETARAAG